MYSVAWFISLSQLSRMARRSLSGICMTRHFWGFLDVHSLLFTLIFNPCTQCLSPLASSSLMTHFLQCLPFTWVWSMTSILRNCSTHFDRAFLALTILILFHWLLMLNGFTWVSQDSSLIFGLIILIWKIVGLLVFCPGFFPSLSFPSQPPPLGGTLLVTNVNSSTGPIYSSIEVCRSHLANLSILQDDWNSLCVKVSTGLSPKFASFHQDLSMIPYLWLSPMCGRISSRPKHPKVILIILPGHMPWIALMQKNGGMLWLHNWRH